MSELGRAGARLIKLFMMDTPSRFASDRFRRRPRVRSGARESMPGMLDTVLNLGLNDDSVEGLAKGTGR